MGCQNRLASVNYKSINIPQSMEVRYGKFKMVEKIRDNGYDISDYQDIDSLFGTLGDMEELIAEAGKRNNRIVMDLVLNHSSDEHPWFLEAKKSRENPYHDYYVWRDGEEGNPPNDMRASFGGSAWQ